MENIEKNNNKKLTTQQVARIMGKSDEFVRVGLQRGILPFGYAFKLPERKKYSYYINPKQFEEFIKNNNS
jgi:hypothetical protein